MNIKKKDVPERTIEKYNYLKSIKDKEHTILSYYKKISHLNTEKPKPLPKPKKRTKKNIKKQDTNNNEIEDTSNLSIIDKEKNKEKEKEKEKLTKKKIVIMD